MARSLTCFVLSYLFCFSLSAQELLPKYVSVRLEADLSKSTPDERKMLALLIEAGQEMDKVFWQQAYGNKSDLLDSINDKKLQQHVMINYGPWERLQDNRPFVDGHAEKPLGANFYPTDITSEEFEAPFEGQPG